MCKPAYNFNIHENYKYYTHFGLAVHFWSEKEYKYYIGIYFMYKFKTSWNYTSSDAINAYWMLMLSVIFNYDNTRIIKLVIKYSSRKQVLCIVSHSVNCVIVKITDKTRLTNYEEKNYIINLTYPTGLNRIKLWISF